jgi:hypothetical protein
MTNAPFEKRARVCARVCKSPTTIICAITQHIPINHHQAQSNTQALRQQYQDLFGLKIRYRI